MIRLAKDKPMGMVDIVFCWLPKVISIYGADDEGYNRPRQNYIFWLVNVKRTVRGSTRTGIFVSYTYEYEPLGDL